MSKIDLAASEEKSFENVNGRTDDGQKVITIGHPEHSSGELMNDSFSICCLLPLAVVIIILTKMPEQCGLGAVQSRSRFVIPATLLRHITRYRIHRIWTNRSEQTVKTQMRRRRTRRLIRIYTVCHSSSNF